LIGGPVRRSNRDQVSLRRVIVTLMLIAVKSGDINGVVKRVPPMEMVQRSNVAGVERESIHHDDEGWKRSRQQLGCMRRIWNTKFPFLFRILSWGEM
jgi:hypothetical protein